MSSPTALILWATQWRLDQKDVPEREAVVADGLREFIDNSKCFKSAVLQRLPQNDMGKVGVVVAEAKTRYGTIVLITVRELGTIV
ncbi:MAG: hypothetical protein HQL31_03290, partial [Planctomycetes bacterium]|nr:hypothetical protein [Planctomycetota bacterium]